MVVIPTMRVFGGPGQQPSIASEIESVHHAIGLRVVGGGMDTLGVTQSHESTPQLKLKLPSTVSDDCGGNTKTSNPPLDEGLCDCIYTDNRDGEGFWLGTCALFISLEIIGRFLKSRI